MKENPGIVSVVVFDRVKPGHRTAFEDWQDRVISEIRRVNGFVGVSSKRHEGVQNEYFTLFQFDSNQNLQHWLNSDTLKRYLREVGQYTESAPKVSLHQGLDIFFHKRGSTVRQPPFHKKVFLGIIAVYPLIIIVGKLFHWLVPGFGKLPFELGLFFEVIIISTLMTYPVMPGLTKWLRPWLYR